MLSEYFRDNIIDLSGSTYGDGSLIEYDIDTRVFESSWNSNYEMKLFKVTGIIIDKKNFIKFYKDIILKRAMKTKDINGRLWSREAAERDIEKGMAWDFIDDVIMDNAEEYFKLGLAHTRLDNIEVDLDGHNVLISLNEKSEILDEMDTDEAGIEEFEDQRDLRDEIIVNLENLLENTADFIIDNIKTYWYSYFQHNSQ